MKYLIAPLIALVVAIAARGAPYPDLLSNGGMEKVVGDLPKDWQTFSIGTPAQFAIDSTEHHSGSRSTRITASDTSRSYLVTDYFPVAVGESFVISAWVKAKDLPANKGHAILIAEFNRADEDKLKTQSCGTPNPSESGWQLLQKKITVPEPATKMRLRIGFSYSYGTTWWDDVSIIPTQPLAMQVDIVPQHFVPGIVPVNVLNRAGKKGNVRVGVALRRPSKANPEDIEQGKPLAVQQVPVELTGEPVQHVDVDASLPLEVRGKLKLIAMLLPGQGSSPISSRLADVKIPPAVTLKPLVPTHWAIEDGPAKIEGQIDVVLSENDRKGSGLLVQLVNASKDVKAKWSNNGAALPSGIQDFSLDARDVPLGEYHVIAQLHLKSGKTIESDQPFSVIPRSQAKTVINSAGYPEIDGKAIFALGVFNGRTKQEGESGFTVSHAYNATRIMPDGYEDDQNCKNFLDRTQEAGMHACCMVPLEYAFDGKWDEFRRRIRMFRNHPALLCWDEEEGVARGDLTLDGLRQAAQIVHEEDPNHPLMIGDTRDVIGHITDRTKLLPVDIMDMGMWWWYPFPMAAAHRGEALQGEDDATSDELTPPVFLTGTKTSKPIWSSLDAYKKNEKSRYPTPQEYRAQAYLGVIAGAKGLMWYGGYIGNGIYNDEAGAHLKALEDLVKQLHELSPVFMSANLPAPAFAPASAPISVAVKDGPNGPVMLVVNRRLVPVDVSFDFAKFPSGQITVLYESRSISPRGGKVADHFDPLGVHVYQLSK